MLTVNLISVFVAAIVSFVVGFLMHGPVAGKLWMKLANIHPTGKEKFSDMMPMIIKNFLVNLVSAYILAMFIFVTQSFYGNIGNVYGAMGVAFWVWLGFIVTSSSMDVIWMGRSYKLWLFESLSSLLSFLAMAIVIANF